MIDWMTASQRGALAQPDELAGRRVPRRTTSTAPGPRQCGPDTPSSPTSTPPTEEMTGKSVYARSTVRRAHNPAPRPTCIDVGDVGCRITGGSSGIGLASTEHLLERDALVTVAALPDPALEKLRARAQSNLVRAGPASRAAAT